MFLLFRPSALTAAASVLWPIAFSLSLAIPTTQSQATKPSSASGDFKAFSTRANAARDTNRLRDARLLYKKALALKPGWAEGWWSLGTIAYDQNSYAEAAQAFKNVVMLSPKKGTAYVMLGLSEFELAHDDLALKHIEEGERLGLDPDPELRHVTLYHKGVLLQRKGKFEAAHETLEQLCVQGVNSDDVVKALGMTMLRQVGRTPPPAGSPDADVVTRVGQGACLAGEKKFDEARTYFDAVVAQYPTYPKIHYACGLFLIEASDLPAATSQFKTEIRNNPADVVSRLQIAAATYKTDSSAGLPYAEQAVKLAPQQPFAHYLLGMLLLDANSFERAIPELEIAQRSFPSEPRIYLALGTAYSQTGHKEEAVRARATAHRLAEEAKKSESDNGTNAGETRGALPGNTLPAPR